MGPILLISMPRMTEKREASKERILKGGRRPWLAVGGRSLVFHAGYYLQDTREVTLQNILRELEALPDLGVTYRLETTGKETQFGNLEELIAISQTIATCGICVYIPHDFCHFKKALPHNIRLNGDY